MKSILNSIVLGVAIFVSFGASATDCRQIPAHLKLREVTFRVVDPTETYNIKMEFPDLTKLKCEANYLEYGTDYYFTVKASEPVKLSYTKKGETKVSRTAEMSGYLSANSVLLAVEREKTPHYLEVEDPDLEVKYLIYIAKTGEPSYARRKGQDQQLKIVSYKPKP